MSIRTSEFWREVVERARSSAALERKSNHLIGYVAEFRIDDSTAVFEFHRGTVSMIEAVPMQGSNARVSGPGAEWQRIIDGEIPFVRAAHFSMGRLKFDGAPLENAWASPAIGEFLKIAASRETAHA
jgi:hypothetical protein